jgi:serine/threonine protein kinase
MFRRGWERFRKIKELGAGSFGVTLLVEDQSKDGRQLVIKVPLNEETETAIVEEFAKNQVLLANLAEIDHPNIVKCLGLAKYDGHFVMMMDYVNGQDLRKLIGPCHQHRRPQDLGWVLQIAEAVCSGLSAVHDAKLVHGDIKPENILVREEDDLAKLTDFGLGAVVHSVSMSMVAAVGGTYPYMAPEAFAGKAGKASDVWAMSVMLYELVTGRMPFWASDQDSLREKVTREDPVPPAELNFRIDRQLNDLILQGLEKDHRRRYRTGAEMLNAVKAYRRGAIVQDELVVGHIDRARDLFNQGNVSEAEKVLQDLVTSRFENVPKLHLAIGEFYSRCHRPKQAESALRRGIEHCPDHAGLHRYLAMVLDSLKPLPGSKERREAIQELQKAVDLGLGKKQDEDARALLRKWKGNGGVS